MKRFLFVCVLAVLATAHAFSQTEPQEELAEKTEITLEMPSQTANTENTPPILVRKNNFIVDPIPFYLTDGTRVTNKEFHNMIGSVPENEKLIKQGKAWKGVMFATLGLTVASLTLDVINVHSPAFNHNKDLSVAMSATFFTSLFSTLLCAMISTGKYCKAAENYNLMIMGIPIPTN